MSVDILMATFNGEKYVRNQVLSLQAQTYEDWHLWVRDDGSIDRTNEIVDQMASRDTRITRVAGAPPRLGVGGSFFSLLPYAHATFVAFCDQDDIWFERKLELLVNGALDFFDEKRPCLIYCDAHAYDDREGIIASSSVSHLHASSLREFLFFNSGYQGCSMLFNRRMTELAGGYNASFYMHDDIIALLAHTFGKVRFLPKALMCYRQHANNVTGKTSKSTSHMARHFLRRRSYVISKLHYAEKAAFYEHFRDRLNRVDAFLFEEYLRFPQSRQLDRLRIIVRNRFSLGGHQLPLLAKTILRRPIG